MAKKTMSLSDYIKLSEKKTFLQDDSYSIAVYFKNNSVKMASEAFSFMLMEDAASRERPGMNLLVYMSLLVYIVHSIKNILYISEYFDKETVGIFAEKAEIVANELYSKIQQTNVLDPSELLINCSKIITKEALEKYYDDNPIYTFFQSSLNCFNSNLLNEKRINSLSDLLLLNWCLFPGLPELIEQQTKLK